MRSSRRVQGLPSRRYSTRRPLRFQRKGRPCALGLFLQQPPGEGVGFGFVVVAGGGRGLVGVLLAGWGCVAPVGGVGGGGEGVVGVCAAAGVGGCWGFGVGVLCWGLRSSWVRFSGVGCCRLRARSRSTVS